MPTYHITFAPPPPNPPRLIAKLVADSAPEAVAAAHGFYPQYPSGSLSAAAFIDIADIALRVKRTAAATRAAQRAEAKAKRAATNAERKAKRLARTIDQRKWHDRQAQKKRSARLRGMYAQRRIANS